MDNKKPELKHQLADLANHPQDELTKLIAEAKQEGRDELFKNVREVKSSSDMSVQLVFMSCRSAQEFRQKADAIRNQGE